MTSETNYSGTLRIKKQSTIDKWKAKGWWQDQIDRGYIYAKGCGRFKTEICTCCQCRRKNKTKCPTN